MSTPKTESRYKAIPLSKLLIDWSRNTRQVKDQKKIEEYAGSMKVRGLLQPIVVEAVTDDPKHEWVVIAGFQRAEAACLLKWEFIDASIHEGDQKDALLINITENVQRKNLGYFELAAGLTRLQDEHQMDGAAIADVMGLSKSYVYNLLRLDRGLCDALKKLLRNYGADPVDAELRGGSRFRGGANKFPPVTILLAIAALQTPEEQIEKWNDWKEEAEDIRGFGQDDPPKRTPKGRKVRGSGKPTPGMLKKHLTDAKRQPRGASNDVYCETLEWVLGERKTPPVKFIGPKAKKGEGGKVLPFKRPAKKAGKKRGKK